MKKGAFIFKSLTKYYSQVIFNLGYKLVSSTGLGLGKYKIVRQIGDKLLGPTRENFVEINGKKLFLDPKDSLLLSINKKYEELETKAISKEVKLNDTVIDIGANIGFYSILFSQLVGELGKVIAIEPDPANFEILKKNVQVNNCKNIILVNKVISENNGPITLHLCDYNWGMHRIYESKYCNKKIETESIRLDDLLDELNLKKIDFIKIDVEGSEILCLRGMLKTIKNNLNLKILTEFAPRALTDCGTEPKELLLTLVSEGFKIYDLLENEQNLKEKTVETLLKKYSINKHNHTNLLLKKSLKS